jgi:hypothetical protein
MIGYLTIRTNHCSGRAELESEYVIKIVGNIDKAQYDKTRKLNEIKLNKEMFQGIHPKIPSSIEYIKSSDYIAICEDRNSWYSDYSSNMKVQFFNHFLFFKNKRQ